MKITRTPQKIFAGLLRKYIWVTGIFFFPISSSAQSFLNGSFEITTAAACDYNLSNVNFTTKMSSTNAYGGGQELDIMQSGCPYGPSQNGNWFVALASPSGITDAFTMTLSSPLVAGNTYTISFWDKGDPIYPPALQVSIGLSTVAGATGTNVYTGPVPTIGVWNNRTFSFVAPNNGQYISVSTPGPTRWVHVDNFTFPVVLPLTITKIQGYVNTTGNTITWETASEKNNDFFTVQRSADGEHWEDIGIISGAGTSDAQNDYSFFDDNTFIGTIYYRIQQTDYDGASTYSAIVALDGNKKVELFPNPASDHLQILFSGNMQKPIQLHIFTKEGISVMQITETLPANENALSVDVSSLEPGMYFITIGESGVFETRKFIVAR